MQIVGASETLASPVGAWSTCKKSVDITCSIVVVFTQGDPQDMSHVQFAHVCSKTHTITYIRLHKKYGPTMADSIFALGTCAKSPKDQLKQITPLWGKWLNYVEFSLSRFTPAGPNVSKRRRTKVCFCQLHICCGLELAIDTWQDVHGPACQVFASTRN